MALSVGCSYQIHYAIFIVLPYLRKYGGVLESDQVEKVVHQLTTSLGHKGHLVVCDNFFMSLQLFHGLLDRGIYAIGTMKGSQVGFPMVLSGMPEGAHPKTSFFWQMHSSKRMAATTWYD